MPLPKESPKKTAHGSRDVTTAEPRKQKETGETKEGITTASPQKRPAEKDLPHLQGKKAKGAPSALESEGQLSPEEEGEIIEELGRQLESSTANTLVAKQPEETPSTSSATGAGGPPRVPVTAETSKEDLAKLQTGKAREMLSSWKPWSHRDRDKEKMLVELKDKKEEKEDARLEKEAMRAQKAAEKAKKDSVAKAKGGSKAKAQPEPKKPVKAKQIQQQEPQPTSAAGLASKLKSQGKKK